MSFRPLTLLSIVVGAAAYGFWIGATRWLAAVVVTIALFFVGCRQLVDDHARAADLPRR